MKNKKQKRRETIGLAILGAVIVGILVYTIAHYHGPTDLSESFQKDILKFLSDHTPMDGSPNTLFDVDDLELIPEIMDNEALRMAYGVSDSELERFVLTMI